MDPTTGVQMKPELSAEQPAILQRLQELGISHVINCTEGATAGFCNPFPDFLEYLDLKLNDRSPDPLEEMRVAVDFAREAVSAGGRVLLHCERGVNRSGTMAIACVMTIGKMTLQEAYDQVLSRRPMVAEGGGPRIEFIQALMRFEEEAKGCASTLDLNTMKAHKVMALKEGTTVEQALDALDTAGGDVDQAAVALWS